MYLPERDNFLPESSGPLPLGSTPLSSTGKPRVLLTIAGHDPSSGAGITADLLTFAAHGFFGTSAVTQLTVQSTQGVSAVEPLKIKVLPQILASLDADLPPAGVKIGMLGGTELVHAVAIWLKASREVLPAKPKIPIVLDPILGSSSGTTFLDPAALQTMQDELLPHVDYVTPNWKELSALTGLSVEISSQAEAAIHDLGSRHPYLTVVATGGDQENPTDLLRLPTGEIHRLPGEHIDSTSTHGTGCAFSSALLCRLVQGQTPIQAVQSAKDYVTEAIRRAPGLGQGHGPLNLLWPLQPPPTK
jgi:hydroxymethylpyrimidine/phosphomethylpyrimidine kinase